jgi:hypothetical protein
LRLSAGFKAALYAAFVILLLSGIVLLISVQDNEPTAVPSVWQQILPTCLALHGAASMVTLIFLGVLFPIHIKLGWRARLNRVAGVSMLLVSTVLVTTAFGLYYAGTDSLRSWTGTVHWVVGSGSPLILLVHVLTGRRATRLHVKVRSVAQDIM